MGFWTNLLGFLVIFVPLIYFANRQGLMVSKSIAAVLFVFRPGKDSDRASLNSCTGWVSHAGRFRESRVYEFSLDAQLSNGDVEVTLLDRNRQQLLRLNRWFPAGCAELDGKGRYYLRWEFRSATGTCALHW